MGPMKISSTILRIAQESVMHRNNPCRLFARKVPCTGETRSFEEGPFTRPFNQQRYRVPLCELCKLVLP
jgi:hypothetical protein